MGTQFRITVIPKPGVKPDEARLKQVAQEAMERVNQSMSTYIPDSELSQFNRLGKGESAVLSPGLYSVVKEALHISEQSNGAFDATLGKAIRLWGFAEDGTIDQQPSAQTLAAISPSIGYQKLALQGHTLTKHADGLELNLSAIAKGYAIDQVAQAIDDLGYRDYLINIGGELRARGKNMDGQHWRVGVERPHVSGGIAQVVELRDQAIATSGDYRNFLIIDGQQFSHTIDSETLRPIYHKLASVSVLSSNASTADALATALLAMGEERGVEFAEKQSLAAYFIIRSEVEEGYEIHVTDAFRANLPE